ncbi:hypothetical protein DL765_009130 [Monosporascus sp. GIB2]|nr:hypothetical protein DL765_009130 [Monosporascus sp. GIB2]
MKHGSTVPVKVMFYSEDEVPMLPQLGLLKPQPKRLDTDTAAGFVKQMVAHCSDCHAGCSDRGAKPLPKRVLKIRANGETPAIQLVEPPAGQLGRYATLSHCWGPTQPVKTLNSNLKHMRTSIPFESLPIVFRQAIQVAISLSLEYIWIDSLCIVQDDTDDWEVEASKMCDYYENGFLNIATAASPGHDVPFLGETDPSWWPVSFELQGMFGEKYRIWATRAVEDPDVLAAGQLFTRAWAWQESTLASSTLYFTKFGLIWDTAIAEFHAKDKEAHGSEQGDNLPTFQGQMQNLAAEIKSGGRLASDPYLVNKLVAAIAYGANSLPPGMPHWKGLQDMARSRGVPTGDISAVWDLWQKLVEAYPARSITYETDRLPALSGVASRVHRQLGFRYLAGLWEEGLPANLCWERKPKHGHENQALVHAEVAPMVILTEWLTLITQANTLKVAAQVMARGSFEGI